MSIHIGGESVLLRPSFYNVMKLGSPTEIIDIVNSVHDNYRFNVRSRASLVELLFVLRSFVCKGDADMLGHTIPDRSMKPVARLPHCDMYVLAMRMLSFALAGDVEKSRRTKANPIKEFDASTYINMARIHLDLPEDEAKNLTMQEFNDLMRMKFPHIREEENKYPTLDEHEALKKRGNKVMDILKKGRGKKVGKQWRVNNSG